jgi:hypothetical protein
MFCQLIGGDVKYSMKSASKSTVNAPCTNRPMQCPLCPVKPPVVHWKSNMKNHFDVAHEDDARVQDHLKKFETSATELAAICAWNAKKNAIQNKKTKRSL